MNPAPIWKLRRITDPLILASASPRRAEILRAIGLPFEIATSHIEEGAYGSWDGGEKLRQRSLEKAQDVRRNYPGRTVLSADTIVLLDKDVLGKPRDGDEARHMLERLTGRWHEVWTALCLWSPGRSDPRTALCSTRVLFRHLEQDEIRAYVESGEPLDMAGAYGIQGVGGLWVREIQGCYFNVVGLPLSQLWDLLLANMKEPSPIVSQP